MKINIAAILLACIAWTAPAAAQTDLGYLQREHCSKLLSESGKKRPPLHYRAQKDYFLQNGSVFAPGHKAKLKNPGSIDDFLVVEDRLWTAGSKGLQEWNFEGELLAGYAYPDQMDRGKNRPRGFYHDRDKNLLALASGGLGLALFDLEKRKFFGRDPLNTRNGDGHSSAATDVVGDGFGTYFISMTGTSEGGFNGILVYDSNSKQILNRAEYNKYRAGVVYPLAKIYVGGNKIFLNNGGWIHAFERETLERDKKIRPRWLAIEYWQNGERSFPMIEGDLVIGQRGIMGCGVYMDHERPVLKAQAFSTPIR